MAIRPDDLTRSPATRSGATGSPPAQAGGRVPPHNLQAEESLLGAMLLSRDAIGVAIEICHAEDFYSPANAHVFQAIFQLQSRAEAVDAVTVADELARAGLLEHIGGAGRLLAYQAATPAAGNAGHYARIVEELALLRRLIAVSGEIAESAYAMPEDIASVVDKAESLVFDVAERRMSDSVEALPALLGEALDRIELLHERGEAVTGLPTGFHDLDRRLAGLQPSTLTIVGARPGCGKTSFALAIASHAATVAKRPVLMFNLEMSKLEVTNRLISSDARIDSNKLRTGRLTESDWPKISASLGRLGEAELYIDDNAMVTVMDVRAKARRLKAKLGDLGLVVVDYIQLMTSGGRQSESRQVEVSEISRGLKVLARELDCPVIALSQLSRNLESRADKRPMLSDLRESGSLEQDADVVIFLYRDEIHNPDSADKGMAEVIVAKHRAGPTGTCQLAFLGDFTRFDNMAVAPGRRDDDY